MWDGGGAGAPGTTGRRHQGTPQPWLCPRRGGGGGGGGTELHLASDPQMLWLFAEPWARPGEGCQGPGCAWASRCRRLCLLWGGCACSLPHMPGAPVTINTRAREGRDFPARKLSSHCTSGEKEQRLLLTSHSAGLQDRLCPGSVGRTASILQQRWSPPKSPHLGSSHKPSDNPSDEQAYFPKWEQKTKQLSPCISSSSQQHGRSPLLLVACFMQAPSHKAPGATAQQRMG